MWFRKLKTKPFEHSKMIIISITNKNNNSSACPFLHVIQLSNEIIICIAIAIYVHQLLGCTTPVEDDKGVSDKSMRKPLSTPISFNSWPLGHKSFRVSATSLFNIFFSRDSQPLPTNTHNLLTFHPSILFFFFFFSPSLHISLQYFSELRI